jgi:large conductance mechanosensitive channel
MLKEFQEFAMRGNMLDMAVGIIIGAAFGTMVSSLVADLFTPLLGLIGGADFTNWFILLKDGTPPGPYATLKAAKDAGAVTLNVGMFVNTMINFLLVAFALFLVIKAVNRMKRERAAAPPPEPTPQEKLLAEIRDLLKTGGSAARP